MAFNVLHLQIMTVTCKILDFIFLHGTNQRTSFAIAGIFAFPLLQYLFQWLPPVKTLFTTIS